MNKNKFAIAIIVVLISLCLVGCSKKNVLTSFLNELQIASEITENLDLKDTYLYNNTTIKASWTSSNESAIETNGTVHRTIKDQQVILIVEASIGDETMKKTFKVTVKADKAPEIVEKAADSIIMPERLEASISLPNQKKVDGEVVTILWQSSHESIISNEGNVTLPAIDTEVTLKATFILRQSEVVREFKIIVPQGEEFTPPYTWHKAEVYFGTIQNETKVEPFKEFMGAIYRKVQSNKDYWLGIEVVVTLPMFTGDENRVGENPWGSSGDMRYLDNASVYLGGNSLKESDVGLSWSVGAKADLSGVDYSKAIAFRPFWRYITIDNKNIFNNASWQDPRYYYYPGDKVRMSVFSPEKDKLQLRIELLEETTIPEFAARRASYHLGENYEKVFLSPVFDSPGMGEYKAVFKRVCALDQVNNEGGVTQPTNASSVNTIWHECYLYREIDGVMRKVPMIESRYYALSSPSNGNSLDEFKNAFIITYDGVDKNLGGEIVTINPQNGKN